MSFRNFRPFAPSFRAGKIVLSYLRTNEDTGISERFEQSQNDRLPSTDMTDLAALLKAGVALEDVSCKLLNPKGRVSIPAGETKTTETKTTETKE